MRAFVVACLVFSAGVARAEDDAAAIMAKMAANMDGAAEARRQFVYTQAIKAAILHTDHQFSRRESREYAVTPQASGTDKKLLSLKGEYRKGKEVIPYTEAGPSIKYQEGPYKQDDIDREILEDLINDLTNDKESRDGISESLFPLRTKDLQFYRFSLTSRTEYKGRPAYKIAFEPLASKDVCIHVGDDGNVCEDKPWKGDAWVDVEDLQPMRIDTQLGRKIPWLKQLGFSVSYDRVAPGVWFPSTYGTEFQVDVLFLYKRTITLSLANSGFQKTDAVSTISFDLR
jgi:hypothetical protein